MTSEESEKYIRWQNFRIGQFTFAINLFLGFSVASLAFAINEKLIKGFGTNVTLIQVIFVWAISAACGSVATISRLLDFRYTARKIKNKNLFNSFLAKYLGSFTWGFFWVQILSYAVGAYLFIFKFVLNV